MFERVLKGFIPYQYKRAVKEKLGVPSLHWSLQNLKRKGFIPKAVVDVGAYEGFWTEDFLEVFPGTKILMVEAQRKKEPYLKSISAKYPGVVYSIALLGAHENEQKKFVEEETGSRVVTSESDSGDAVELTTTMLDNLVQRQTFPMPEFLKLDVQGYEMEVLKGAEKCLFHATACLLEISLLNIGGSTPLLAEMVSFMDTKGYQAYDISQFIRRPYDKALYQIDMFFVKKDSWLVTEKRW